MMSDEEEEVKDHVFFITYKKKQRSIAGLKNNPQKYEMYPHVTTYKLWAELDGNTTSTKCKMQILLHKKGMSKIWLLDLHIYILVF